MTPTKKKTKNVSSMDAMVPPDVKPDIKPDVKALDCANGKESSFPIRVAKGSKRLLIKEYQDPESPSKPNSGVDNVIIHNFRSYGAISPIFCHFGMISMH